MFSVYGAHCDNSSLIAPSENEIAVAGGLRERDRQGQEAAEN